MSKAEIISKLKSFNSGDESRRVMVTGERCLTVSGMVIAATARQHLRKATKQNTNPEDIDQFEEDESQDNVSDGRYVENKNSEDMNMEVQEVDDGEEKVIEQEKKKKEKMQEAMPKGSQVRADMHSNFATERILQGCLQRILRLGDLERRVRTLEKKLYC